MRMNLSISVIYCFFVTLFFSNAAALAQGGPPLDRRIQAIMARPEFSHSHFGIKF